MAAPKLPSIREIIDNPATLASLKNLPTPMLVEILDQLKAVRQRVVTSSNVPETPIELAIQNPKYKWMDARHLHYLGEKIADAVSRSKNGGEQSALIVTMPPRHAKSHTCSVWTPFWYLARYPEDNVLLIGSEHNAAAKWGEKVRRLIELFGEPFNLRLNPKKVARDDWELMSGGGMKCVGAGGQISGNPAKLLIGDDLIKNDEQARSEYQRESMWDWWETTVLQRIEPDTTTILIGTRYHEDDILGRVLAHSSNEDGLKFELVTLTAKADSATPDNPDPLDRAPGEGLWPDHPLTGGRTWGQSYYDRKEQSVSPYVWDSVYQQRPSSPTGNMVDPTWWRFYRPTQLPVKFDQECQSWDLSLDAVKKTDSQHAGLILSRAGAMIYIRDGFAEHCDINKVLTTIRAWAQIYPKARAKLVERATAGPALAQTMRFELAGILPWPPKGRQKGSKEACLDAIIPAIRSGNVLFPMNEDGTRPEWVNRAINQISKFPRDSHDDWVDALSQGVGYLLPGAHSARDQDHQAALNHVEPKTSQEAHTLAIHAAVKKLVEPKIKALQKAQDLEDRAVIPFTARVANMTGSRRSGSGMW